ncbi:hypothetical protein [Tunicatimonas pelagia]|uniref:hypothetical protein n=1 Tax=Tunicatimonas pelagia TaxID=931531 RepID=UPI002665F88A|nr:hypothetical protein [Tunicatimonas pelagia]WKN44085.1 hypothetical protein P0M28_03775 [Tunicatimonas pelagia]
MFYYFIIVLFPAIYSCKQVNEDGDEISANQQRVVDAMRHLWQISDVVYSLEGYQDSVATNVDEMYFAPCQLAAAEKRECTGYYQTNNCSRITIRYGTLQTSNAFTFF